jgi:hypothetical protein
MDLPERNREELDFLESLQKEAALGYCVDISPKTEKDYRELAEHLITSGAYPPETDPESLARSLRKSDEVPDPSRWSAHERPDHRRRLWHAEQAVIRGVEVLQRTLPSPLPAIGTLPTRRLNAGAIPVPSTKGYIIAIDSGYFSFTAGWSEVLAACLTGVSDGGILDRFVDLCFCEVILGTAAYLDSRPATNPVLREVGSRLDPVFEAFLLGHEYAHVMLGHQPVDMNVAAGSYQDHGFLRQEELDADALGFKIALGAFPDPVQTYVSVAGYLCAWHLIERGWGLLKGETSARPPGDSHPPAIERRASLFQVASESMSREALTQAMSMLRAIEDKTIEMWKPLERGFLNGNEGRPKDWAPTTAMEKSAALLSFKFFTLGPPLSMR